MAMLAGLLVGYVNPARKEPVSRGFRPGPGCEVLRSRVSPQPSWRDLLFGEYGMTRDIFRLPNPVWPGQRGFHIFEHGVARFARLSDFEPCPDRETLSTLVPPRGPAREHPWMPLRRLFLRRLSLSPIV